MYTRLLESFGEWWNGRSRARKDLFSSPYSDSILETPRLLVNRMQSLLIVGGIARSGTTFLDRLLGTVPEMFCYEECHSLKNSPLTTDFQRLHRDFKLEFDMWTNELGASYRNFDSAEAHRRVKFALLSLLAAGTEDARCLGKDFGRVRCIVSKTPSAEFTFAETADILAPLPTLYAHCVRRPETCAASNWRMPWVNEADEMRFVESFAATLQHSQLTFEKLERDGRRPFILHAERLWNETQRETELASLFLELKIDPADAPPHKMEAVDTWTADRRRPAPDLSDAAQERLARDERTHAWRLKFGYA